MTLETISLNGQSITRNISAKAALHNMRQDGRVVWLVPTQGLEPAVEQSVYSNTETSSCNCNCED